LSKLLLREPEQRHFCGGVASILHPEINYLLHGTVTDLSLGGCYVDVAAPLSVGARTVLMPPLKVGRQRISDSQHSWN